MTMKCKIICLAIMLTLTVVNVLSYGYGFKAAKLVGDEALRAEKASAITSKVAEYYVILEGNVPLIQFRWLDPDRGDLPHIAKIGEPEKTIRIFEPQ